MPMKRMRMERETKWRVIRISWWGQFREPLLKHLALIAQCKRTWNLIMKRKTNRMATLELVFSKEEKVRMRAPWQKALIIKTFGKRMAFSFVVERVRKMWNPCGGMDCIDLGYDYYLVKFELVEDVDSILTGGP